MIELESAESDAKHKPFEKDEIVEGSGGGDFNIAVECMDSKAKDAVPQSNSPYTRMKARGSEEGQGDQKVAVLEVLSRRTVFYLITFTRVMYVSIGIIYLSEALAGGEGVISLVIAFALGLFVGLVIILSYWIHLAFANQLPCVSFYYLLRRDWERVELSITSTIVITSAVIGVGYWILLIGVADRIRSGAHIKFAEAFEVIIASVGYYMIMVTREAFGREKLDFRFYFVRFTLTFTYFAISILRVPRSSEESYVVLTILRVSSALAICSLSLWNGYHAKRTLAKMDYMATRFKQISFRFCTFVLPIGLLLVFVTFDLAVLSEAQYNPRAWHASFLLLRPTLLSLAWVHLLIGFLPPQTSETCLGYLLVDKHVFKIDWKAICLAAAASCDAYYDGKRGSHLCNTIFDKKSRSSAGHITWSRKGYRILGWIRNDSSDAHCIVAEVTASATLLAPEEKYAAKMKNTKMEQHDWTLSRGDLIVAFRGTGSLRNALTDLAFCRQSLPPDYLQSRYELRERKETNSAKGLPQEPDKEVLVKGGLSGQVIFESKSSRGAGETKFGKRGTRDQAGAMLGTQRQSTSSNASDATFDPGHKDTQLPYAEVDGALAHVVEEETTDTSNGAPAPELRRWFEKQASGRKQGEAEEVKENEEEEEKPSFEQHQGRCYYESGSKGGHVQATRNPSGTEEVVITKKERALHSGRRNSENDQEGDTADNELRNSDRKMNIESSTEKVATFESRKRDSTGIKGRIEKVIQSFRPQKRRSGTKCSQRSARTRRKRRKGKRWNQVEQHGGTVAQRWYGWVKNGMVHSGFLQHYESIRSQLLDNLDPLLAPIGDIGGKENDTLWKPRYFMSAEKIGALSEGVRSDEEKRRRSILVTGHSLGGAMATLAALDLRTRYQEEYNVRMITFAAPRVGDRFFANVFNEHVPDAVRAVHDKDPIPGVPKMIFMFKHVGHELLLDSAGTALLDRSEIEKAFIKKPSSRLANHSCDSYDEAIFKHLEKYHFKLFKAIEMAVKKMSDEEEKLCAKAKS